MLRRGRAAACLAGALALLGLALPPLPARAADTPRLSEQWDETRAQRLLARALAHLEARGRAGLVDFSRQGPFVDRDLYVYVLDERGEFLASGGSSANLIGQNVREHTDANGKPFFAAMIEEATRHGGGRMDYRWLNPVDQRDEPKITLFKKQGELIVAVGYYTPRASAGQARNLLERAVRMLAANEPDALAAFSQINGGFIEDDLYVFVVDQHTGRMLAHGASPALVGRDAGSIRDPRGKPIITDMLNIARTKSEGELEYAWRNPLTEKVETKRTFFRLVNGKLVGVGYYTR